MTTYYNLWYTTPLVADRNDGFEVGHNGVNQFDVTRFGILENPARSMIGDNSHNVLTSDNFGGDNRVFRYSHACANSQEYYVVANRRAHGVIEVVTERTTHASDAPFVGDDRRIRWMGTDKEKNEEQNW
jgi:hypothetical protein